MGTHPLQSRFAQAALPLEVAQAPFVPASGAERVVQLDIARDRRGERFRMWPGASTNRVVVQGVDRRLHQLVLLVDEPKHRFLAEIPRWTVPDRPVVRKEGHRRWVSMETPGQKRHFLLGLDEAHLFIAQLPRGLSSVDRAREALKGREVARAERDAPFRTIRQGEWFLIALDAPRVAALDDVARLAPHLVAHRRGIAQAALWNRAGRPHVADEVLVLRAEQLLARSVGEAVARSVALARPGVYVRGKVKHPDHATVELKSWRLALPNAESFHQPAGVFWVD
ncbi:MAG: hypothetical protein AB1938_17075 [Myxococcota bacterium]